jgi:formylmethanofuran dehydrogenase subunit E
MLLGEYIFKESPKYKKVKCSKCGDEIEKTAKAKTIKFVCFKCKRARARERTKKRNLESISLTDAK